MRVLDKLIFSSCTLRIQKKLLVEYYTNIPSHAIGAPLPLEVWSILKRSMGDLVAESPLDFTQISLLMSESVREWETNFVFFFSVTAHSALSKYTCQLTFRKVTNVDPSIGLLWLK